MFDDDEDEGEAPINNNRFGRTDDYGGGLEDQRTNQAEMDQLMQPCLDFDDKNDEEEGVGDLGLALDGLRPTLDSNDDKEPQYNIEKYFSNGNVDRDYHLAEEFSGNTGGGANNQISIYTDSLKLQKKIQGISSQLE